MPDISFSCPHCGQSLEAPEELAGESIECPSCDGAIAIAADGEDGGTDAAACPECGAPMAADTVLCLKCGFHLKLGKRIETDFG